MSEKKPSTLRERAEALLGKSRAEIAKAAPEEIPTLIHELEVYQVELEIQNEELRRAQQELEASRDYCWELYNFAPVAYLTLSEEGVIVEANLPAANLFGLGRKYLLRRNLAEFIRPEDRDLFYFHCQEVLASQAKRHCELRIANAAGSVFDLRLESIAVMEEAAKQIRVSLHDITDLKQAEAEIKAIQEDLEQQVAERTQELHLANQRLRQKIKESERAAQAVKEREARLDCIVNAALDGIITLDEKGAICSLNRTAEKIFGYREEEILGRPLEALVAENSQGNYIPLLELKTGQDQIIGVVREVEGRRKGGGHFPMELSFAEFPAGDQRYFIAILRDVTERKRREREIREHLNRIAQTERLRMMGEMASGLAHELNQPLTALAAYLQTGRRMLQMGQSDPTKLTLLLKKADEQALRAGRLIQHMREFLGKQRMQVASFDINAVIQAVLEVCRHDCRKNGILVKPDLAERLPPVIADKVQIEQVLMNLMRNAIEAMAEVEEKRRLLTLLTQELPNDWVQVTVQDGGKGIPLNQMDKVFDPFFTTKETGMGMGLAICRSILETHGGRLWVEPQSPYGVAFHFTLPIAGDSYDAEQS